MHPLIKEKSSGYRLRVQQPPVTYVVCLRSNWTFLFKRVMIRLQLNKTSLLQSTPPLLSIHHFQNFFQFWNAFCWIARRSRSESSSNSSFVWNRRTIRVDFNLKGKNSAGAKSGEWYGCGATVFSCFATNARTRRACQQERCRGAASRSCSSILRASSFALPPSPSCINIWKVSVEMFANFNKHLT